MLTLTWRSRLLPGWKLIERIDPSTVTLAMIREQCDQLQLDCEVFSTG